MIFRNFNNLKNFKSQGWKKKIDEPKMFNGTKDVVELIEKLTLSLGCCSLYMGICLLIYSATL